MPEVSEIRSNLPRSTQTVEQELALPPSYLKALEGQQPGERRPSSEEAEGVEQWYIKNYLGAADQRWPDQQRFMGIENERRRFVNLMHPHKVFRLLQHAGVDARIDAPEFDVWLPEDKTGKLILVKKPRTHGRLWLHSEAVKGRVGISAWVWDKKLKQRVRRAVTSLEYPYGPEWSLMNFDQFDVPLDERWRGWRTAMLHLIEADVLTEDEVNGAFGPVPLDSVSLTYRKHMFFHRKTKVRVDPVSIRDHIALDLLHGASLHLADQWENSMSREQAQANLNARAILFNCSNAILAARGVGITREEVEGAAIIERAMGQ